MKTVYDLPQDTDIIFWGDAENAPSRGPIKGREMNILKQVIKYLVDLKDLDGNRKLVSITPLDLAVANSPKYQLVENMTPQELANFEMIYPNK